MKKWNSNSCNNKKLKQGILGYLGDSYVSPV